MKEVDTHIRHGALLANKYWERTGNSLFIIIINFKFRAIDGIQRSMKMLEIV